ncbi:MAG TPA: helix-turn-helix domain-containing protein [Gemmataceae bacterium]|nr:helix-turn-helix domain-containing protein [Gemmataceae bacterium]
MTEDMLTPVPQPAGSDVSEIVARLLASREGEIYRKVTLEMDRIVLEAVLRHTHGNQVEASQLLGISRTTLRSKLKALGLTIEKRVQPGT